MSFSFKIGSLSITEFLLSLIFSALPSLSFDEESDWSVTFFSYLSNKLFDSFFILGEISLFETSVDCFSSSVSMTFLLFLSDCKFFFPKNTLSSSSVLSCAFFGKCDSISSLSEDDEDL